MMIKSILLNLGFVSVLLISCNNHSNSNKTRTMEQQIKTEVVSYKVDTAKYHSYIAFDDASAKKRPVVFVIHEWWGQNDYVKRRARELAALGYFAVAIDLYGHHKIANSVEEASALSKPFYQNSQLALKNYKVATTLLHQYPQADTSKIAIIGYCFGGSMALEMARMGERLNGVVSFHGGLSGSIPQKDLLKAKILVCHGADDQFVSKDEVEQFKKQMDSIHADYKFVQYEGATHAFSNPDATEWGIKFKIPIAYNNQADTSSWNEMKDFFQQIFQ